MPYSDSIVTFDSVAQPYKAAILADLDTLYGTPTGRVLLDKLSLNNGSISVVGLTDAAALAGGSPAFGGAPDANGVATLTINYLLAGQVYWFNDTGSLVRGSTQLVIAHELSHMADSTRDPLDLAGGPGRQHYVQPTDSEFNAASFDFRGGAVFAQNAAADDLGHPELHRASYIGATYPGVNRGLVSDISYTSGQNVDIVRFGDQRSINQLNNINHNARTDNSSDLIFGFGGNDNIAGGGGNDYIYGGDGNDVIRGGIGDDALYGEKDNDILFGNGGADLLHGGYNPAVSSSDLSNDGVDTADYSTFSTGSSGKGIKISITTTPVSTLYQSNTDASHAIYVTDQVRDKATDTLISIETIKATAADDILQINSLSSVFLAGPNGQGGLAEVDLGAETKKTVNKGDYVDLSGLNEAAKVTLNGSSLTVAAAADATRVVTIKNDEHILGSNQNDLFQAQGTPAAIDFASGGGHDLVETVSGGTYDLMLKGLNQSDVTIFAGGQDFYISHDGQNANYDAPYTYIVFEFIGFKVNATGDTITFVDSTRPVGSNVSSPPDYHTQGGTTYAGANSSISSVTFGDGSIMSAVQLWAAVGANSNVLIDTTYAGTDFGDSSGGYAQTYITRYFDHLNSTYFQADPLGSGARMAAAPLISKAAAWTLGDPTKTTAKPQDAETTDLSSSFTASKLNSANGNSNPVVATNQSSTTSRLPITKSQDGEAGNAVTDSVPAHIDPKLADAAMILRSHNSAMETGLPGLVDPAANLVGYDGRRHSQIYGTSLTSDAVSAANFNKLIETMAAFQAGDRVGTLDASSLRPRDLGLHALTLAAAH